MGGDAIGPQGYQGLPLRIGQMESGRPGLAAETIPRVHGETVLHGDGGQPVLPGRILHPLHVPQEGVDDVDHMFQICQVGFLAAGAVGQGPSLHHPLPRLGIEGEEDLPLVHLGQCIGEAHEAVLEIHERTLVLVHAEIPAHEGGVDGIRGPGPGALEGHRDRHPVPPQDVQDELAVQDHVGVCGGAEEAVLPCLWRQGPHKCQTPVRGFFGEVEDAVAGVLGSAADQHPLLA